MAAAVIIASTTTTSHCLPKSCLVTTPGPQLEAGQITGVVTPKCDGEPPQEHKITTWIEYRPYGGDWREAPGGRNTAYDFWTIPDAEGFSLRLWTPCREGIFRIAWEVVGRGAPLPDNAEGNPFHVVDYSWAERTVSAGDCAVS